MKITAIVFVLAMGATTQIAFAGVAPNSAGSAAAQSGAKVAPAKTSAPNEAKDDAGNQSGTTE